MTTRSILTAFDSFMFMFLLPKLVLTWSLFFLRTLQCTRKRNIQEKEANILFWDDKKNQSALTWSIFCTVMVSVVRCVSVKCQGVLWKILHSCVIHWSAIFYQATCNLQTFVAQKLAMQIDKNIFPPQSGALRKKHVGHFLARNLYMLHKAPLWFIPFMGIKPTQKSALHCELV